MSIPHKSLRLKQTAIPASLVCAIDIELLVTCSETRVGKPKTPVSMEIFLKGTCVFNVNAFFALP